MIGELTAEERASGFVKDGFIDGRRVLYYKDGTYSFVDSIKSFTCVGGACGTPVNPFVFGSSGLTFSKFQSPTPLPSTSTYAPTPTQPPPLPPGEPTYYSSEELAKMGAWTGQIKVNIPQSGEPSLPPKKDVPGIDYSIPSSFDPLSWISSMVKPVQFQPSAGPGYTPAIPMQTFAPRGASPVPFVVAGLALGAVIGALIDSRKVRGAGLGAALGAATGASAYYFTR